MSESTHHNPKAVRKYTQLETLSEEDVYAKGVALVTDKIIPFMTDVSLFDDGMAGFPIGGMELPHMWAGEKILYSPVKDVRCNVEIMLIKDIALDKVKRLRGIMPDTIDSGEVLPREFSLETLSPDTVKEARLKVVARFYDGKMSDMDQSRKGILELTLDPAHEATVLDARLGDLGEGSADNHDGIDIGTVNTIALWLQDVQELQ